MSVEVTNPVCQVSPQIICVCQGICSAEKFSGNVHDFTLSKRTHRVISHFSK